MSSFVAFFFALFAIAIAAPVVDQAPAMGCGFDVAFVLDRSESVTEINFSLVKEFVKNVIKSLISELNAQVGKDGLQFALVPFNSEAHVDLYLNQGQSSADVLSAVDGLAYFPGLSNPFDAMTKLTNDVFVEAHGDRPDRSNAVILVSDGSRTEGTEDPAPLAAQFRQSQNGQIIAVGVDGLNGDHKGFFYQNLLDLTADPAHIFNATDYAGLVGVFKQVASSLHC